MQRLTNTTNMPLPMAVWLGVDEYDGCADENYMSATDFLKATRRLILEQRLAPQQEVVTDVANMAQSRIGTAIHNSVEQSWVDEVLRSNALQKLGIPQRVQQRIVVNPDPKILTRDHLPVYLEQRITRELEGYRIGGKFDIVADGILADIKTTNVWTYMSGSNDKKYQLQGSIYRWLNPDIITKDYMYIYFVFLNWLKGEYLAKQNSGYPENRVMAHRVNLMSEPETELFLQTKIRLLKRLKDAPETELPPCTPEELWQEKPVYKYYKNPASMKRSTKNFQSHSEAHVRWIKDGQVGVIKEVPGLCKACSFCPVFNICTQKDGLIAQGLLAN